MGVQTREVLKGYFETGDRPTQPQFEDLIDTAATITELQTGSTTYAVADGSADVITVDLTPAITAYQEGVEYWFRPSADNATTTPTANFNTVGAKTIKKLSAGSLAALALGDIKQNRPSCAIYDATDDSLTLQNPATFPGLTSSDIGSTVQAYHAALAAIAALSPSNGDIIYRSGGAWISTALTSLSSSVDQVARDNTILNAFRIAEVGGLSILTMVDSVTDAFEDDAAGWVDDAGFEYDADADLFTSAIPTDRLSLADVKGGFNTTGLDGTRAQCGVRFTASESVTVTGAKLDIHAQTTAGNIKAHLYTHGNATPIATMASAQAVNGTGEIEFTFDSPAAITASTDYVLEFERVSAGDWDIATVAAPGTDIIYSGVQGGTIYNISSDANMDASEDFRVGYVAGVAAASGTLTSPTLTAAAAPDEVRAIIDHEAIDSVTLNTDLTAEASRDGGTTWTTITLAEEADLGSSRKIFAGTADVSGQPSGTSVKVRISHANSKGQNIHAVGVQADQALTI